MTTATAPPPTIEHTAPVSAPPAAEAPAAALVHLPPAVTRLRAIIAGRYSGPTENDGMMRRAHMLATARNAPDNCRNSPGDVMLYMEWAAALDIPLAVAMSNVFFQKGKPGIHAAFMHALLIRAGHRLEVLHADGRKVTMRIRYADGRVSRQESWHVLEARNAGLFKPDSAWNNYSTDMLWARCTSRLCRRHAPDVTLGLHTPEEITDGVDEGGDPLEPVEPETDADGRPVIAPDVAEIVTGLNLDNPDAPDARRLSLAEVRDLWKDAGGRGLLTLYAGTNAAGAHLSVQEVLWDQGEAARTRETTGGRAELVDAGERQADVADAAEVCCSPEYLARHGDHEPSCALHLGDREPS